MRWPVLVVSIALGACSFELSARPGDDGAGVTTDGGGGGTDGDGGDGDGGTGDDGGGGGGPGVVTCPSTYTAGYRLETTPRTWLAAEAACEQDLAGKTHLVVIDDEVERVLVSELAQALPGDAWVGMVRDPGGTAPWPWRYVTGGLATFAPFEGGEPNNLSGDQFTVVLRKGSRLLYDYGTANLIEAICECDQRPPVNADFDPAN